MKKISKLISAMFMVAALNVSMVSPAFATEVTGGATDVTAAATDVTAAVTEAAAPTVDLNGTYHATLGIQTCDTLWITRNGYYNAVINPEFGTDKYALLFSGKESTKNYVEYAGTFNDATIEGNGTYTVSLTGADFGGETSFSQIHVATDIPDNDSIKFTDVTLKVNGKKIVNFADGYKETETKYLAGGIDILCINHWRKPLEDYVTGQGAALSNNGGVICLTGTGDEKVEVTFAVSGFAYDKVEQAVTTAPTKAPAVTQAAETDAKADDNSGNMSTILIVVGVIVVVAVISAVVVIVKKKKA